MPPPLHGSKGKLEHASEALPPVTLVLCSVRFPAVPTVRIQNSGALLSRVMELNWIVIFRGDNW
jgi:hypothetical protein